MSNKNYDENDEIIGWEREVTEILSAMGVSVPASHKTGHTADDCPADWNDRYYYED